MSIYKKKNPRVGFDIDFHKIYKKQENGGFE